MRRIRKPIIAAVSGFALGGIIFVIFDFCFFNDLFFDYFFVV
jgi:1,4-dihydroxy-2-naphthoyl-CoA synthase